jgi:protein-disulfide isomerase
LATFEFRDYAFLGDESILAAEAARCANDQSKFWEYHDLIFYNVDNPNLSGLSRDSFDLFAEYLELDMAAFGTCMDDHTHQADVIGEREDATALGVGGTPTVLLNGEIVTGIETYDELFDMIEEMVTAE